MTTEQQDALQTAANKLEDDRWEVAPKETAEYEKKTGRLWRPRLLNLQMMSFRNFL